MSRLTYNFVKKEIESKNYKLLSEEYKNSKSKLKLQCPEGHEYETSYHNFQQGHRCPYCAGKMKHNYDYVKKYIENFGYKLLSREYKGAFGKLRVQCPEGHEYEVTWGNFQTGYRCPYCAGKGKRSYDYVKEQIEKKGYKLLSREYKDANTKLKLQCLKGHIFEMRWGSFQRGQRCPYCAGNVRLTYEYVKEYIENEGYKLLSKEYKNNTTKLKIQCFKGHEFKIRWSDFRRGVRCPMCWANSFTSKAEKEIVEFLESRGVNIIRNDRKQIVNPITGRNLELDIWIPKLNKAIEFNGRYWHSFEDKMIKDRIKIKQCVKKGIDLLVIKEQDWIDDKRKLINMIGGFVNEQISLLELSGK